MLLAEKSSKENDDSADPKTPVTSSSHVRAKSKMSATPFYTAAHCSKCRFDRLETSSFWIGQIKMAESVGKHFVASAFFKLALISQAEVCSFYHIVYGINIHVKRFQYFLSYGLYMLFNSIFGVLNSQLGTLGPSLKNICQGMDTCQRRRNGEKLQLGMDYLKSESSTSGMDSTT